MVTKNQRRFPLVKTLFFAAVAAWAASRGWKGLEAFANSRSAIHADGEPSDEGSPGEAAEEERAERKRRNKKVIIGALITLAFIAAGIVAGLAVGVYGRYLFDNLSPDVAVGLLGGKILIYAVVAAVHKHTPLPGAIALALASSLSNALFALVTTHVLGQSMAFPFLGLDWNYILLLSSIGSWILAINYTLWRIDALSFITALTITVALLLLSLPGVNFLYYDLDWQDPIITLSRGFARAEALLILKDLSWFKGGGHVS